MRTMERTRPTTEPLERSRTVPYARYAFVRAWETNGSDRPQPDHESTEFLSEAKLCIFRWLGKEAGECRLRSSMCTSRLPLGSGARASESTRTA